MWANDQRGLASAELQAQILAYQQEREADTASQSEPKENTDVGLGSSGGYDRDLYSSSENYVTSIATGDAMEEEDEEVQTTQRRTFTMPQGLAAEIDESAPEVRRYSCSASEK